MKPGSLKSYASLCGRVLARAHARTGDPAVLTGYMGKSSAFEDALADFSVAYASRTSATTRPCSKRSNPGAWRRGGTNNQGSPAG